MAVKFHHRDGVVHLLSSDVGFLLPSDANKLIKQIGVISHQSQDLIKKSPDKFIEMLYRRGHFPALEHSWDALVFGFQSRSQCKDFHRGLLESNSLFCITKVGDMDLLVSGDAMVWMLAGAREMRDKRCYTRFGLQLLSELNSTLYPVPNGGWIAKRGKKSPQVIFIDNVSLSNPEKLVHTAIAFVCHDFSRGFTHELVRHRTGYQELIAFLQESTRYVKYGKGKHSRDFHFVLPYCIQNPDTSLVVYVDYEGHKISISIENFVETASQFYEGLIWQHGWKPEQARQFLLTGMRSQIAVTANLAKIVRLIDMRAHDSAQSEIRYVAIELLRLCQGLGAHPIFNSYEISETEDGIGSAVRSGTHIEKWIIS